MHHAPEQQRKNLQEMKMLIFVGYDNLYLIYGRIEKPTKMR